ncbi:MAG: toll/interleukin-1 receptor domain-containing protein [Saprospiraceae bacterium]
MRSFPPIQSVLEKARRFRQASIYLTGKERERFTATYLPYYLDWARHLFELGLWRESRCLFQEIQLVKPFNLPFSIIWEILEEERKGPLTCHRYVELTKKKSNTKIETLEFPKIILNEGNTENAKAEFSNLNDSLKKSVMGQLIELRLQNKWEDLAIIQSMLDSELKNNNDGQQSIFILLHRYLEVREVIGHIKSESRLLKDNLIRGYASLKILEDLINLPLSNFSFKKIEYLMQRAGTIAQYIGTVKDQQEFSTLIIELERGQKGLPIANQKVKLNNKKDRFHETLHYNFFADYEHIDYSIDNNSIQKEIKNTRNLSTRFNTKKSLYLPLVYWEIKFEIECLKYLHLNRLESLLNNENFKKWCRRQEEFKTLSKIEIFVSYSMQDHVIMKKIIKDLESYGITTILDIYELKSQISIQSQIYDLIRNADHTLLFVSQNSLSSEWVAEESAFNLMIEQVKAKTDEGRRLIPIVVDKLARVNFQFFGDQVTQSIQKKQQEISLSEKYRQEIGQEISPDIISAKKRIKTLKDNYPVILDMIKSDFTLDFYDDITIAQNIPKLIQRILDFNRSSSPKSGKASTSP